MTPTLLLLTLAAPSAEVFSAVDVETAHTSNVYMDSSEEWDLGMLARGELGLDLDPFWSVGYTGEVSIFSQHPELNAHFHELYAFLNPVFGEETRTDLMVELRLSTLRNDDEYQALNYLLPGVAVELGIEPAQWLRARISADVAYRWFYDAPTTNAVDGWAKASLAVNLPTRTTVSTWARMGARWFTQVPTGVEDDRDLQLEVAAHIGQGLWPKAGLQLDYVYRRAFGPSGLLLQSLTDAQVNNVGTEFLYSGHLASVGVKQVLVPGAWVQAFLRVESRSYEGWPAYDAALAATGEDRRDLRVSPGARVAYAILPDSEDSPWPRLDLSAEYRYLSQDSNSDPFDTSAHLTFLSARATW